MSYLTKKIQAARIRGRRMANRRWQLERERRARLDAIDPVRFPGKILRRIVVIDRETTVREAVFYDLDSLRGSRAKLRHVLAAK